MENRIRILIADDEPDILEILRLLLEGEGYEVTAAADGREAVQKADASVDLYILDIHMPVMSGFAAAMEIRRKPHVSRRKTAGQCGACFPAVHGYNGRAG